MKTGMPDSRSRASCAGSPADSAQRVGFGQKVVLYSPTGTAPQGSTIKVYYGL